MGKSLSSFSIVCASLAALVVLLMLWSNPLAHLALGLVVLAGLGWLYWREAQGSKGAMDPDDEALVPVLQHIEALRQGHWDARLTVSSASIGVVADALNQWAEQGQLRWRQLEEAEQRLGALVRAQAEEQKSWLNRLHHRFEQGQAERVALRQGVAYNEARLSGRAALAQAVEAVLDQGAHASQASQDLNARWTQVRGHVQESETRVKRTQGAWEEAQQLMHALQSLAQQSGVLAAHAAVLATKAGERGVGFRRVADNMRDLSEQAAQTTARAHAVLKTAHSEGVSALAALGQTVQEVDEGARLSDVADEASQEGAATVQAWGQQWQAWFKDEQAFSVWFQQWLETASAPQEPLPVLQEVDLSGALQRLDEQLQAWKGVR